MSNNILHFTAKDIE